MGNLERYSLAARVDVSHEMSRASGDQRVLAETLPGVEGGAPGAADSIIVVQEQLRGGGAARQRGQLLSPGKRRGRKRNLITLWRKTWGEIFTFRRAQS